MPYTRDPRTKLNSLFPYQSSLQDGLAWYFALEESAGATRIDTTGRGNNLASVNNVGQTTGKIGNCAQFDAASQRRLSSTSTADFQMGDIDFTISLYVRLFSKPGNMNLVTKDAGSPNREYFITYNLGVDRFQFFVGNGTGIIGSMNANSLAAVALNTWYLLTCWHDSVGNTVNIKVDNLTTNTAATSGPAATGTANFLLGTNNAASIFLDGLLDEVGGWKRLWTANEHLARYNNGLGTGYPSQ